MRRTFALLFGAFTLFASTLPAPAMAESGPKRSDGDAGASTAPYLFGRSRADAQALSIAAGLKPVLAGSANSDATVVSQSIAAGRQAARGTVIVLRMGVADGQVTVPALLGYNREAAGARASATGLRPLFYGSAESGVLVASQSPPSGKQVAKGTYVQLQMRAPAIAALRVPSLIGLTAERARALASSKGLRIAVGGANSPGARVVSQTPGAGAQTVAGELIQLRLQASEDRVPNFVGRSRRAAQRLASAAGLVLTVSGGQGETGLVSSQGTKPGSSVEPGSRVAVTMSQPTAQPATNQPAVTTPPASAPAASTPALVVPSVAGLTRDEAVSTLTAQKLQPEIVGGDQAAAVVTDQSPAAGSDAKPGDVVRLMMTAKAAPVVAAVVPAPETPPPAPEATAPAATSKSSPLKWIVIAGALLAAAAAAVAALIFRRRRDPEQITPVEPTPRPEPKPRPQPEPRSEPTPVAAPKPVAAPQPIAPPAPVPAPEPIVPPPAPSMAPEVQTSANVTYSGRLDAGRPTARFSDEPISAARALALSPTRLGMKP